MAAVANQGKNCYEAEIDCIQELCDFLRFNVQYTLNILQNQPISPSVISKIIHNIYPYKDFSQV